MLAPSDSPSMTPQDILDYLRDHPEFLQTHPEAVEYLLPPKMQGNKGVADFQSYMIQRLKADKDEVLSNTKEIIENSRANMNNQQRVHAAVLRLLEASSFDDFIHTITMDLAPMMNVDIAVLVVETDDHTIPHVHTSGVRVIPDGTVQKWMGDRPVILQDDISGIEAIYGGGAGLVKSQILLRIGIAMTMPPAILAFGSRYPETFQDGQATDQILFLARVIERCFRSWLHV